MTKVPYWVCFRVRSRSTWVTIWVSIGATSSLTFTWLIRDLTGRRLPALRPPWSRAGAAGASRPLVGEGAGRVHEAPGEDRARAGDHGQAPLGSGPDLDHGRL